MTKDELSAYYRHLDNVVILRSNIQTERMEGRMEGREQGLAEGREQGLAEGRAEGHAEGMEEGLEKGRMETNIENARNLKKLGVAIDIISQATGLSKKDIETL